MKKTILLFILIFCGVRVYSQSLYYGTYEIKTRFPVEYTTLVCCPKGIFFVAEDNTLSYTYEICYSNMGYFIITSLVYNLTFFKSAEGEVYLQLIDEDLTYQIVAKRKD
jgi:hypothetical protein